MEVAMRHLMSTLKLGIENAFHAGTGGRSQENMGLGFRAPSGRVVAAKATLVSGFERNGYFHTREAAARAAAEWTRPVLTQGEYP
jgi:hypothetical protein